MKRRILALILGTIALTAASAASARVNVDIGINPFGYGSAPPPMVYVGGGSWGGDRGGHRDGHRGGRAGGGRHR